MLGAILLFLSGTTLCRAIQRPPLSGGRELRFDPASRSWSGLGRPFGRGLRSFSKKESQAHHASRGASQASQGPSVFSIFHPLLQEELAENLGLRG